MTDNAHKPTVSSNFEFTMNGLSQGNVNYLGEHEPQTNEVMYWLPKSGPVSLVVCDNTGQKYDGGRSGRNWVDIRVYAQPVFAGGALMIPEGGARTINDHPGLLIPRSRIVDILVERIVAAQAERAQARRDESRLRDNLTAIFGNLVRAAER